MQNIPKTCTHTHIKHTNTCQRAVEQGVQKEGMSITNFYMVLHHMTEAIARVKFHFDSTSLTLPVITHKQDGPLRHKQNIQTIAATVNESFHL